MRSPTISSRQSFGPQIVTGLRVLYQPFDREANVDVIAIHGIGANADGTWTSHGVNWLEHEEMLPSAIPDARIMRFAYESQWLGRNNVAQHPSGIAAQFLSALSGMRVEFPRRPLVLICHCFGGIAIQRAIIEAKIHSDDWLVVPRSAEREPRDIVDCVAGIVFLGTPFRGSQAQTYAKMIGTIWSYMERGNSKIYDLTEPNSQEQRDQLNNFVRIVNRQAIPICCFYEQHKSDLGRIIKASPFKKEMIVVEETSATIDGLRSIPLAANHFNMHKYSGPEDPNYKAVLPEIKKMVGEAQNRVSARLDRKTFVVEAQDRDSKPKIECLETLSVDNPADDKLAFQKQIDEDSQETKTWIFSNGIYTRWKNIDGESLLWIFGEDGLGKTPLTISLIDDLTNRVERSSQRRALAYCFCQSHTGQGKDANAVIRSILYQIVLQQSDQQQAAFEPWLKTYRTYRDNLMKPDRLLDLWKILQLTLAEARYEVAYFLLYRPEECGLSILNNFPSLVADSSFTRCRIKWMVVSRMDPALFDGIETPCQINLATPPTEETTPPMPSIDLGPPLDIELRASVSCSKTESAWECSIKVNRDPLHGKVEIVANRVGRTGVLQVEAPIGVVPHTEMGSEGDRDFSVTFLNDVEVSLGNDQQEWILYDRPVYLFEDQPAFKAFQERIFGLKLIFQRSVENIYRNGEKQSSDQDIRLWATDDTDRNPLMIFFTNSRQSFEKKYLQVNASKFIAIKPETAAQRGKILRLDYKRDQSLMAATEAPTSSRFRLSRLMRRSSSQDDQQDHLDISFFKPQDRIAFLTFWPKN